MNTNGVTYSFEDIFMSSFTPINNQNSLPSFQQMERAGWNLSNVSDNQSSTTSAMAQPTVKKYLCTVENCGKGFKYPKDLRRHMTTHTGEKNYLCDIGECDKAFTRQDNLDRHKNNDH